MVRLQDMSLLMRGLLAYTFIESAINTTERSP
jgi:hypothetical protein